MPFKRAVIVFKYKHSALHYAAAMSGNAQDAIKILVDLGAYVNATNEDMRTPLFMSVKANNPLAAATLVQLNADYKLVDKQGMTAFDSIQDISDWIVSDIFDKNFKNILKSKQKMTKMCSFGNYCI